MRQTYLAFDLGAESGRVVLAALADGILRTEEIHRFANVPVQYEGHLHWNVPELWAEIRTGLGAVRRYTSDLISGIGVDTWGLDYALLGEKGSLLQNPLHYRDKRTEGVMEEVFARVPRERIYTLTGIQFMRINTLYQLFAAAQNMPRLLSIAERFLMIPDLLNFWLTGLAVCEYTNATTTQFVDARGRCWSTELFSRLGLPSGLPATIVPPGSAIGGLLPELCAESGLAPTEVIVPACHDTGSAVAAMPLSSNSMYISSGTWSLLGAELNAPVLTAGAMDYNFTNEGGVCGTYRLLKNIGGLWLLQGCRRRWQEEGQPADYADLVDMAASAPPLRSLVDPDHASFLSPDDMVASIRDFCRDTDQPLPRDQASCSRTVLDSLALKYALVSSQLESITGRKFEEIRIVGGGARNRLLNQLTANATGKRVIAGPVEATALGNIVMQMLATGTVKNLDEGREVIARSFPAEVYEPQGSVAWETALLRFREYCRIPLRSTA